MTSFRERQEETDFFWEQGELLRTYRGVVKKIVPRAQHMTRKHPRLQKEISESTLRKAISGDHVWEPIAQILGELRRDVALDPRPVCEPPQIPESIDDFRKGALDYAPNTWWYSTLGLDDLCKPSSFQTWMSRGEPKEWPAVRERAVAWRSRVMAALERWERCAREQFDRFEMLDTWVKDVLDTKGEVAALQEFKRLRDYESISYRMCFDPAEPERPQFEFRHRKDESEDAAAFKKLVDEGFRFYRPDAPKPETREVVATTQSFVSDDFRWEWYSQVTVEQTLRWDAWSRSMARTDRLLRVRVKVPPSLAVEGETIEQDRCRRWIERKAEWYYEFMPYVWRWRDVDEYDVPGGADARDEAIRRAGLDAEGREPVMDGYLLDSAPPIEKIEGGRVYTLE
jgi:hypothetical protein